MQQPPTSKPIKGRGQSGRMQGRYETTERIAVDDGWGSLAPCDDEFTPNRNPQTQIKLERARSIISKNQSPDVPFNLSVNPYRGCEHGCVYCFARPSHSYLELSPGLDFETKLSVKANAVELFESELRRPSYRCEPITLGINTDAYQPLEREHRITRQLLEISLEYRQPIQIITKGRLILRDLDLLSEMAKQRLIAVAMSITTLDDNLKRIMEPRTANGRTRLNAIEQLTKAGVPCSALVAPIIPVLTDHELESIIAKAAGAGAVSASYVLLRLPHEVAPLFIDWLQTHFPDRAQHIENRIRDLRGGKLYDSQYGERMTGTGPYAELIGQRFQLALKKNGLNRRSHSKAAPQLDCSAFRCPPQKGDQLGFDLG